MRRIISLLLALMLVVSVGCLQAYALVDEKHMEDEFEEFCKRRENVASIDSKIQYYIEADGLVFFVGHGSGFTLSMEDCVKIADWYFHCNFLTSPDTPNIYVYDGDRVYHLRVAYNKGIVTDFSPVVELLEAYPSSGITAYPMGDVNGDSALDVTDATTLQKQLCGIKTTLVSDPCYGVADMNMDGVINIRDATAIQKALAGIE